MRKKEENASRAPSALMFRQSTPIAATALLMQEQFRKG